MKSSKPTPTKTPSKGKKWQAFKKKAMRDFQRKPKQKGVRQITKGSKESLVMQIIGPKIGLPVGRYK